MRLSSEQVRVRFVAAVSGRAAGATLEMKLCGAPFVHIIC